MSNQSPKIVYCKFGNFSLGFYFPKTSHMRSFVKIKLTIWRDHSVVTDICRERSGSVVECLTRDQRASGSSLTGVTVVLEQDTFILA